MRADARQARWGDIALAGMAGADFTCRFLRIGRFGDAPSAGPSLWSPLAHFEDDIDFAMSVSEHTSSHTRATPGEEAAQASRPSGGARQAGGRRAAHLWHLDDSAPWGVQTNLGRLFESFLGAHQLIH